MHTHDLHTVCIRKTIWIAFYLITLSYSTTDYFYVGRSYWNPDTFFFLLVFAFKIIHFISRCTGFEFFAGQKMLVSSYFCVIAVFLPSIMQIKRDRCVADNYLPVNSCHDEHFSYNTCAHSHIRNNTGCDNLPDWSVAWGFKVLHRLQVQFP